MSVPRRAAALAVLLMGLIIVLPACGGSSSTSKASDSEAGTSADSGADGGTAGSQEGEQGAAQRCQELAADWQGLMTGGATIVGGGPEDAATARSQIESLRSAIPESIAGAFATFASSTEKVLELMDGYDEHEVAEGHEAAPADLDARMDQVAAITSSAELTDALAQIEAYFASNCPPA